MRTLWSKKSLLGFTLIELLVVIAIIAILASVLLPAVQDAMVKGKMSTMLNNAHNLYIAVFSEITGAGPIASPTADWPKATLYSNSTAYFAYLVTSKVLNVDFSFFAAPGILAYKGTDSTQFKSNYNAWCVTEGLTDNDNSSVPFIFTKNVVITKLNDDLSAQPADVVPFGKKGACVLFKGGSTMILKPESFTNNFNPAGASNTVLKP